MAEVNVPPVWDIAPACDTDYSAVGMATLQLASENMVQVAKRVPDEDVARELVAADLLVSGDYL